MIVVTPALDQEKGMTKVITKQLDEDATKSIKGLLANSCLSGCFSKEPPIGVLRPNQTQNISASGAAS
jgi:hypothetical protein